ncbi:MAG: SMP-30/gluconolactonase/LRE family protein [Bacteroidota bacterium]
MKYICFLLLLISVNKINAQAPVENYPEDPASIEQSGVPKGELIKFSLENSKIFPGTSRDVTIYIPAQYKSEKAACVYVNQDGVQWKAPTVFDNLIHKNEMPITIGVFVTPGTVKAVNPDEALNRVNRSFEYDGLGDAYVRFLLEELLPEVEKMKAADGRAIRLSKSGNDRAIGGSSSGAVCAFTAAWERPNEFSRVFSAIGTYTGLRGADRYDILVRKHEPKPIRIFLQDGSNDLNNPFGDWFKANESMERALTWAGYEVNHVWGEGGHNGKHGTAVFPEAMRWLWKDHPRPIAKGKSKNPFLTDILLENEDWEVVGDGYGFTEGTAVNAAGEVFFHDIPNSKTYKIGLNKALSVYNNNSMKASGAAFTPAGNMAMATGAWADPPSRAVLSYDGLTTKVLADSAACNDITVNFKGNTYITQPDGRERPGKLILIRPNGKKEVIDSGLKFPNGLCLSPDQTQMYVTESATHWVWAYTINADGTLSNKQKYGYLHVRDTEEWAWSDGLKCDRDGRIYVTTLAGIQVMDQLGRVNAIIPTPTAKSQVSNLCFGGPNFDILYASSADKVFRRKVKVKGANAFEKPFKAGAPRL